MVPPSFLFDAYKILLRSFGSQGWWPTTPPGSDHPIYVPGKSLNRLSEKERFEICLGTILTQNTSWGNVVKVLSLLTKKRSLHFSKLLKMPSARMEVLFRSSGYFRQKTKRVKNFLLNVRKSEGRFSSFFKGSLESVRSNLLALNGIGAETADSMLLYAGGYATFVVDAYTKRIAERWGVLNGKESVENIRTIFMSNLPNKASIFGEYHALLVRLAKDFCQKRNPRCLSCPMRKKCAYGRKKIFSGGS